MGVTYDTGALVAAERVVEGAARRDDTIVTSAPIDIARVVAATGVQLLVLTV